MAELEIEDKELADKIKHGKYIRKDCIEYHDDYFAYKYSVKSGYVRRRETSIWKSVKWEKAPMEKHKKFVKGQQVILYCEKEDHKPL
jgi:hypothetical protein